MQINASALSAASWFKSLEKTGAPGFSDELELKTQRQDNSAEGVPPTTLAGANLPTSLLSLDAIFMLQDIAPVGNILATATNNATPDTTNDVMPDALPDPADEDAALASGKPSAEDEFMAWMKMTPEERLRAAILEKLGMTEEDLENLPPEERKAVERKITDMIKESVMPGNEDDRAKASADASVRLQAQLHTQAYAASAARSQSLG